MYFTIGAAGNPLALCSNSRSRPRRPVKGCNIFARERYNAVRIGRGDGGANVKMMFKKVLWKRGRENILTTSLPCPRRFIGSV